MSTYHPIQRVLWNLSSAGTASTTISASGNSGAITCEGATDLGLMVNVTGAPTGTAPTLDVQIDIQDPDGNWYPSIAKITQLTTAAGRGTAYLGLHMPNVASSSAALVLPHWCRVTWTLGGTAGPTYPQTSIALIGR
ncbi:hypothetical protein ACH40F_07745 [Streptomyces sp. NPDC020794]|uniref:hypothetical protein n=1 Tax=unclassified Streptomyces TaxID=2593676 RepID=UPI0036EDD186